MSTNSIIYISVCLGLVLLSGLLDRKKTVSGIKKGWKMFYNMLLPFLGVLIIVSILLYFVSPEVISRYLGPGSGALGFILAAVVGSVTLIPAFISYPMAAGLLQAGAGYSVVATFMTTLMMVGVVTLPIEIRYLGKRAAVMRNLLNLAAAVIIGLVIGVVL